MKSKFILFILAFVTLLGAQAQVDRSKMPEPGPTPTINLGKPYTFKLDNGLTVLVVEDHKLPRVSVSISIDNPPYPEKDKAGLSSLVSAMLGNGTKNMSKEAFNEEVDYMGATIFFGSESAFAQGLSKYTPRIIELLADGALNPLFTEEDLETEKKKLIENIKSGENSAAAVASRVRNVLAYGTNHPYGEYITEETVNNITLDDIKNHYSNFFVPSNAYMVISGDVTTEAAKKLIEENFGSWLPGKAPAVSLPKVEDAQYRQINFVDMPNAVQSELAVMNTVNLKMADEDHHAALVANYILGGAFGSYLNMNLREKHGFTYGARSSLGRNKNSTTTFRATTKVRNAVTDSAVVEMLKEIKRIRVEPVSDEDLANAKAKFLGNFIMALENPRTVADYAINIKTENLPEDFYKNFIAKINAVTKEDVQRVANKYFKLDKARIVVVGKGKDVLEGLENITFEGKKIPVLYFDKYGNPVERPDYTSTMPEGVTAKDVLQKYIDAIGGTEKLIGVNTLSVKAEGSMQGMTLNLEIKNTKDNKFYQNVLMMGNSVSKQVFDGEKGYMVAQGQKIELKEEQINDIKASAAPFPELNLLSSDAISLEGVEDVNGKKSYAVKISDKVTLYFDVESGLKTQQVTTVKMQGMEMKQALRYDNYKEVSGILFPFAYIQSMGPQNIEFTVTEIQVNEGVTEEDFK